MEKRANMAKKKKSQVELDYAKQRRRIQSFIRKHEKEGFQFEEGLLPSIPKKITKASVSRLQKITPEKLYSKAVYAGTETYGEIVSSYKGRQLRRQEAKRKRERKRKIKSQYARTPKVRVRHKDNISTDKSFYVRTVLSGWYATLENYQKASAYYVLRLWMNQLIIDNGEEAVAKMLEDAANHGLILVWEVAYTMESALEYMGAVMRYLQDQGDLYFDSMEENIQYWKDLGEAIEEDEDWERPF